GRSVKRILHCIEQLAYTLLPALALAQEHPVVVLAVGVVRIDPNRLLEVLLGLRILFEIHVHQGSRTPGRCITLIGTQRLVQFLQRNGELAGVVVAHAQVGVCTRTVARGTGLRGTRRLWRRRSARCRTTDEDRNAEGETEDGFHGRTSCPWRRARWVRSCTLPASWPHAPSISSPRVLRTVATTLACIRISWKRRTVSGEDRSKPALGNGLNGIKLNLHGTSAASSSSSRACAGWSLTPASMTYSKVTKSRGEPLRCHLLASPSSSDGSCASTAAVST